MEKPIISLFASAVKTYFWLDMYEQLSLNNKVPFEIVFAGNVRPEFDLPENFYYIYSEANPIQCYETARRNSKGKYIMFTGDDVMYSPEFLNEMYWYIQRLPRNKTAMVTSQFIPLPGMSPVKGCWNGNGLVGLTPIMPRCLWSRLGGLDKRFTNVGSDLDLILRAYEAGVYPFLVPSAIVEERVEVNLPSSRLSTTKEALDDYAFLEECWMKSDGTVGEERLVEFQPFTEDDISIVR